MISLIIPTRWIDNVIVPMLQSVSNQYDELIIVDDEWDNLARKINKGLSRARGDYLVVANDDIILVEGNLKDLCQPEKVLSPVVVNGSGKAFHAHLWGMSRGVYEKSVGVVEGDSDYGLPGYYEGFNKVYFDDTDYWMKLEKAGFVPEITHSVKIRHDHPATTISAVGGGEQEKNREIFVRRWGSDALNGKL